MLMRKPRYALTRHMSQFAEFQAVLAELRGRSDAELGSLGVARDRLEDFAWHEAMRHRVERLAHRHEADAG
jgi:hypothetical protein